MNILQSWRGVTLELDRGDFSMNAMTDRAPQSMTDGGTKTAGKGRTVVFLVSHSSAGGAQEIWANLAEGFRQRGDDVQLMALYPLRKDIRTTAPGLEWVYVVPSRPGSPFAMLGMLRALVAKFRSLGEATVFTAMPAANVLAPLAAKLAGGKVHVVISHHSPADTHNPLLNRIDSLSGSLGTTSAVISVSNAVSASLDHKPGSYRAKRKTIYNALPPRIEALIADMAEARSPRTARGRTVVATGRLATQKNYPLLIRAAAYMPDVVVKIVGVGPEEERLKQLALETGVADRVLFMGHRPREEALALVADGDVFVQVSHFEGHSLALIEAARLGLPLVVSDVPVQIEGTTAQDGGSCAIAVDAGDPAALADAIQLLLADPAEYARYAALAAKLGAEASYDRMLNAYEALAA